ncbi:hypothetical protein M433DRAFT_63298 [Acidomyces richmondensis BFW]|nr:MAG: hypothetical protein FE78DRAFT_142121 [Acidomyces sp. 'richmondensis']KYG47342.1 hypothetical protein M433DRAFT_63298 [Acidomyces richmondensis BFW]
MTQQVKITTRYRPGKAEIEDEVSEEYESETESNDNEQQRNVPKAALPKATSFPVQQRKVDLDFSRAKPHLSLQAREGKKVNDEIDLEGFVTASESSDESQGSGSTESGEDEISDEEEEEEEDEEESSEEEQKKPMLRPTFMSKAQRAKKAATASLRHNADYQGEEEDRRKAKADELLQAQLERDAAARAAGRRAWDDDVDLAPEDEVDDTDGIDPEAERAAWKLRELKRVRRERLAIEEKEKEREEVERRRNMTAEEREQEDREYIMKQQEERERKGKMAFMQKYHHKGAFFAGGDDDQDEEIKKVMNRDLAGARYADETADKAILPEYMRIRDMTRLGRKGRTKYKDLKTEDTGRWGRDIGQKRRDFDGLDYRFQPEDRRGGGREQTGANTQPVGERRRREDDTERRDGEKRPRYE